MSSTRVLRLQLVGWHSIDKRGACFVTRFKRNAALTVQQERAVPRAAQGSVLRDHVVLMGSFLPGSSGPAPG
jgi:hypothetical protein